MSKAVEDMKKLITPYVTSCIPVGSRVTCDPAPKDTDEDFLCRSKSPDAFEEFENILSDDGWMFEGSQPNNSAEGFYERTDNFTSYRKGSINLIVAHNGEFATKFLAATSVCHRLNLLDKTDRIAVFQAILYGNYAKHKNGKKKLKKDILVVTHTPPTLPTINLAVDDLNGDWITTHFARPAIGERRRIDVLFRNMEVVPATTISEPWIWDDTGDASDIMAYRFNRTGVEL